MRRLKPSLTSDNPSAPAAPAALRCPQAFWGTWSVTAEYDLVGLNDQSFTVPAALIAGGDVISGNNRDFQCSP